MGTFLGWCVGWMLGLSGVVVQGVWWEKGRRRVGLPEEMTMDFE